MDARVRQLADSGNHTMRKIAISTRTVTTVVGSPDRVALFSDRFRPG